MRAPSTHRETIQDLSAAADSVFWSRRHAVKYICVHGCDSYMCAGIPLTAWRVAAGTGHDGGRAGGQSEPLTLMLLWRPLLVAHRGDVQTVA
jgi:hypothetical protein